MKNKYLIIRITISIIAPVILFSISHAQRIIDVAPGLGTLNEAVDGDTTETGDRIAPDSTMYRLEKGGLYLLTGSLENRDYTLRIEAAEGDGARPVLQPAVVSGGESSRPFRPRDDIYLTGLYITNEDELGGINLRTIRASADSIRIVIDDCHIDKSGQSAFRLDNPGMRIFITNSVISNIGQTVDPNNGRAIDDRGNDIDSLWIENTTFYNLSSNILRDGGTSTINFMRFNQNTSFAIGQRGLDMGEVAELTLTNNIFYNVGFLGSSIEDDTSGFERRIVNLDSLSSGEAQSITISHNNFYLDTAIITPSFPDSIFFSLIYSTAAQAFLDETGTAETNIAEALDFISTPSVDSLATIISIFYTDPDPSNNTPPFDDGGGSITNQLPFDFLYSEDAMSATASTDGQPLGDLNWWDGNIPTSLRDNLSFKETTGLINYPNPFQRVTQIRFMLADHSNVHVSVVNTNGQLIATLSNTFYPAGVHELKWDAKDLVPGMYLIRMQVGDRVATQKMILQRK